MKRLLFVTTNFENGAIPNILLDLAPLWRDEGWDCHFLALEPLPEHHASVQRCRALGFPLTSLNVSPRSVWRALWRLKKAIRDCQPNLISTHLGRADIYTPWVKGRVLQVSTHHSVKQHASRLTLWGYKISDSRVAWRTGVSQACNDSFLEGDFLRTPHSVIPNPVSMERLIPTLSRKEFRLQQGWTESDLVLACVGRLVPVKNHASLLRAFASLRQSEFPQLKLLIAGEGPLEGSLRALSNSLGLSEAVRFLGAVDAIADVYRAADLMVFPSLREGLGLVVLEAWTQECPVVTVALPAIREFLVDGENGYMVESGEPASLAEGIRRCLKNLGAAQAMALRGKQLVQERFSPDKVAQQYSNLFQKLLRDFHPS